MVKVDNRNVLYFLARRFLKVNRGRNILAIISIFLTTLLFTTLFTGASSMFLTKLEADKKLYLTSSHATIQQLSQTEALQAENVLKTCPFVERYGADQFAGIAVEERLHCSLELHTGDSASAENRLAVPTEGSLPTEKNELAVSTQVLDALGIPHVLGSEIVLHVSHGENAPAATETFRLCGYWPGDSSDLFQWGWVSGAYASEHMPMTSHGAVAGNVAPDDITSDSTASEGHVTSDTVTNGIVTDNAIDSVFGTWTYCVWYRDVWHIREKTQELNTLTGLSGSGRTGDGFRCNPAFLIAFDFQEGSISPLSIAALTILVLLAGYLIIYNIFSISVKSDIRTYGLLKNVGITGKQLKKIVRIQAFYLCALGIPIGIPIGNLAGLILSPALNSSLTDQAPTVVFVSHPAIYLLAALFSLFTVYLSTMQACRLVQKLSPVEALRMAESGKSSHASRRSFSVSAFGMAMQNIRRTWKKGAIVTLSIALSLAVLYYVSIACRNIRFEDFAGIYLDTDFQLDKLPAEGIYADFQSITPEVRQALDACPYSQCAGYVYLSEETVPLTDSLETLFQNLIDDPSANWEEATRANWAQAKESGLLPVYYMGISRMVFDALSWPGEPCSWEEFASGDRVLIRRPMRYLAENEHYYADNDTVNIRFQNGSQKAYTMLGEVSVPYTYTYPYFYLTGMEILVPEKEYQKHVDDPSAMKAVLDAIPGQEKALGQYLKDTVLAKDSTFHVSSILELQETYDNYVNRYYLIGGLLCAVLFFIGVMNFFNTTATSILSRKKELALLEAVGMADRQIQRMLTWEGCVYLGGAFFLALLFTCSYCRSTFGLPVYTLLRRTALPCLLAAAALLFTAWAIPRRQFQKMQRVSLTDRLRM